MSITTPFPRLLHAFFYDWLINQRNTSHHTIVAYRDTWRLFLRFVAQNQRKTVAKLELIHLGAVAVLAFLNHMEQERHVTIATRNCRLAALRSFFTFVASFRTGTLYRLLDRIDRQYALADRYAMLLTRSRDAFDAFTRDIIEMRCATTDDGTKGNDAIDTTRGRDLVHGNRHFECPGNTNNLDIGIGRTVLPQATK